MKQSKHKAGKGRVPGILMTLMAGLIALNLAGCEGLGIPWLNPEVSPSPGTPTLPSGDATPDQEMTQTPTQAPPPESLTIWLPPEMDTEGDQPAATLLRARLEAFSSANDGIEINVRIKEVSGVGGLLDALIATNAAAPDSLPGLIALPRRDLETAALKSLIYPIDDLTTIIDEPDWYPYAHEMALIQGTGYGVPFVGDALVLAYRTDVVDQPPISWDAILGSGLSIAFAADDPQASLTLALYQAAGGAVQDNQRRPTLDVEVLTEVLQFYGKGMEGGTIASTCLEFQTETQAWQAFQQKEASAVVVSLARYLQSAPEGTSMVILPPLLDAPATAATGWVWAVATPKPERQALSARLAEALVEPQFLSGWSQALGRIPARPTSLDAWNITSLKPLLNQISLASVLKPNNDIVSSLGPILRDATMQVLRGQVDPAQAAEVAKESLQ